MSSRLYTARLFQCQRCHAQVVICQRCDRGQRYCGGDCAELSRQASRRRSVRRYQLTRQCRLKAAARQQRFRDRQQQSRTPSCQPIRPVSAKVTHQGSASSGTCVSLSTRRWPAPGVHHDDAHGKWLHCHRCAIVCSALLRRTFLRTAVRSPPT